MFGIIAMQDESGVLREREIHPTLGVWKLGVAIYTGAPVLDRIHDASTSHIHKYTVWYPASGYSRHCHRFFVTVDRYSCPCWMYKNDPHKKLLLPNDQPTS